MDYFENESGLDPAEIAQASPQGIDAARPSRRRSETEVSDVSDLCRLLRARRDRPSDYRPTITLMTSRRRIAFTKAGTTPNRTRLQQGFATGEMGFSGQFAQQQS